jgi:hypothetical protein
LCPGEFEADCGRIAVRQVAKELQDDLNAAQREKREAVAELIKIREDNQRLSEAAQANESQVPTYSPNCNRVNAR